VGIAVTDELQIAANALDTLPPAAALDFLQRYAATHSVELVVVGMPVNLNGQPAAAAAGAREFMLRIKKRLPNMPVEMFDERFTSKMAKQVILEAGVKKMGRRNKELIDKVSACIMLQSYMEYRNRKSKIENPHD
jgi:putative Holliday junction resolvase